MSLGKRKRECERLLQKGDVNACSEGDVPLLSKAVELDDVELVKNILQCGADVNKTDKNGRTCLHVAVSKLKEFNSFEIPAKVLQPRLTKKYSNKSIDILNLLLAYELNVNVSDNYRKTALHYSVEYEQLEFTNMLLEAGADVNLLDDDHETPLIIACRLYLNLQQKDELGDFSGSSLDISHYESLMTSTKKMRSRLNYLTKIVDTLITPAARVNMADEDGYTAVHLAAKTDNVQMVERLLGAGGDVREAANTGETVLHCAARNSCSEIMDILLNVQQSLEVINARMTKPHEKTFKRVKRYQVQERIYFIDRNVQRSQVFLNTLSGKTALMVALENSNEQTALKLLSRHPDLNAHTDEGYTALHFAALGSCTHVVRHLLHAGCNVNKKTEEGHTPLMLAGNKEITLLLCDAGADVNLVDKNGDKALHMAIYRSEADVVQVLINKGTVIDGNFPEPLPPLVLAAALNEIAIVQMLLKAGANVNVLSSHGISPLMAAAATASVLVGNRISPIFQILHEHGADFNMTGKKGRTALMYLVKHGDMQAYLGTLVSFGADLDIKDSENKSALVYCLLHTQQFQYSETLLNAGANPLVGPEYRYLMGKVVLGYRRPAWHRGNIKPKQILEFIVFNRLYNYLRMLACNGVVLKGLNRVKNNGETEKMTAMMLFLDYQNLDVIKYLLATCYLTVHDLRGLRQFDKSELYPYTRDELKNVIFEAITEPWPLVKLAFITVSTMLGESPEREERLSQTSLPPKMKQLLMFKYPVSFLPVNDWRKISLCYDPVDYETLQRPRPLMHHWPIGINFVR